MRQIQERSLQSRSYKEASCGRRRRGGQRRRQRDEPTMQGPERRKPAPSLQEAPAPLPPSPQAQQETGGGKRKHSRAKSLGNLGDESQGARRRVGRRNRREAGRPATGPGAAEGWGGAQRLGRGAGMSWGRGRRSSGTTHGGLRSGTKRDFTENQFREESARSFGSCDSRNGKKQGGDEARRSQSRWLLSWSQEGPGPWGWAEGRRQKHSQPTGRKRL